MSQQSPPDTAEIILSAADINRAGAEGVISQSDADRLIHGRMTSDSSARCSLTRRCLPLLKRPKPSISLPCSITLARC